MHSKKTPLFIVAMVTACFTITTALAQRATAPDASVLKIYRESAPKINDLVHTKLRVSFDYQKCYLYGKEWVTLKPHIYPTDTLRLDAKGMDINALGIVKAGKIIPLKYSYDSLSLAINLDKVYTHTESYTIYISYTSKPNQLKEKGSRAITDAKGLYFINPDGKDKTKPVEIWTQGETEANSAWFPTIDKPNQKTTDEIYMTVPAKYVTLSNGKLVSQTPNADGTRTDYWKMDLPHSPYLFMMAVGDFKIYHDKWKDKQVNYYLEPAYAPYAKEIFGLTPQMIDFYSKTLGVDFPWYKYSQIVVRDYVSGAMENTSATLHGQHIQATHRELLDRYYTAPASTIAHELFHQWFGDLVTGESWSNITLHESFANFSETIWAEHHYGQDEADAHNYRDMQTYLVSPVAKTQNLVRFYYADKEDVFDLVSYQKGGRILNMLRHYLGNTVFYKGLNIYLKANAFKSAEAQQLRLAFEEASGLDLNWYFNQWYYGAGHPELGITYKWDDATKTQTVYLAQSQAGNAFILPFKVDVYAAGKKERYSVWMRNKADTLTFKCATKPDLVNVDAEKILLVQKTDVKTQQEYAYQYFNAPLYVDRYEAIAAASQSDKNGQAIILAALKDKYYGLRVMAINALKLDNADISNAAIPILADMAAHDENTLARAAAITALGKTKLPAYMPIYDDAVKNQSYAVQGAGLTSLALLDGKKGMALAKTFEADNKGPLSIAIITTYALNGTDEQWPYVANQFNAAGLRDKLLVLLGPYTQMVSHLSSSANAQQGIKTLTDLGVKYKFRAEVFVNALISIKNKRQAINDDAAVKAAQDGIKAINDN